MKKAIASVIISLSMIFSQPINTSATETYMDLCEEIGTEYRISPELLNALIEHESNFRPMQVGKDGDSGLCQIIPRCHRDRIKRLGVTDIFDPRQNITVCADLLLDLFEKYEDPYLVLMAYNMGEKRALELYNQGIYSKYAQEILDRAYELETIDGKHISVARRAR